MYPTDNFPDTYSYQVDFYIEIDLALVVHHGGSAIDMTGAIDYINALVTAASAIYEREVDTHCECIVRCVRNVPFSQRTS